MSPWPASEQSCMRRDLTGQSAALMPVLRAAWKIFLNLTRCLIVPLHEPEPVLEVESMRRNPNEFSGQTMQTGVV